jgi:RimJ/RimL family protein N-acetyltransferase
MKLKPGQVLEEFEVGEHRVVIRAHRPGDAPECLRHINRMVAQRTCINMQKRLTLAAERAWLRASIARNRSGPGCGLLVVVDGEIVGGAGITPGPMEGNRHVATLGIGFHKCRGMGIGTRVMKLLERLARERLGVTLLRLSVFSGNAGARRLYRRLGFRQVGRVPRGVRHYGKHMDEIIMVKPLRGRKR